jgi:hypothetical protein
MAATPQYAVLQKGSDSPSAEQIRRAFRTFSNLTDADAVRLAANAQGILMRQLGIDEAKALHRALQAEGVAATMVAESDLQLLPNSRALHRVELTAPALVVFDLMGRSLPVSWSELTLIAAGTVPHIEMTRTESIRTTVKLHPMFGVWPVKIAESGRDLEMGTIHILELVVASTAARYEINATQFPFKYVIDRPGLSVTEKFVWLVHEIAQRATNALLNRGARDVRDGVRLVRGYANRQMFTEEMVWLLWSRGQTKRSA